MLGRSCLVMPQSHQDFSICKTSPTITFIANMRLRTRQHHSGPCIIFFEDVLKRSYFLPIRCKWGLSLFIHNYSPAPVLSNLSQLLFNSMEAKLFINELKELTASNDCAEISEPPSAIWRQVRTKPVSRYPSYKICEILRLRMKPRKRLGAAWSSQISRFPEFLHVNS